MAKLKLRDYRVKVGVYGEYKSGFAHVIADMVFIAPSGSTVLGIHLRCQIDGGVTRPYGFELAYRGTGGWNDLRRVEEIAHIMRPLARAIDAKPVSSFAELCETVFAKLDMDTVKVNMGLPATSLDDEVHHRWDVSKGPCLDRIAQLELDMSARFGRKTA